MNSSASNVTCGSASGGAKSRPYVVYGIAIGWLIANLVIALGTIPIDFIPSRRALILGVAYGAACAVYHVGAAGFTQSRLGQLTNRQRGRMGGLLTQRVIGVLAVLQLAFGTAAFINGIGGLSTWVFGHTAAVNYTVSETKWTSLPLAALFSGERAPCARIAFSELTPWQNTFKPCLDRKLESGSRLVFHGRESVLGLKVTSLPPDPMDRAALASLDSLE